MYTENDICIAVFFYEGEEGLVERVRKLNRNFPHVLIVNNGSGESSLKILGRLSEIGGVTILNNKKNMGIGYALNQALEFAWEQKIQLLLTMDQDSEISERTILRMAGKINVASKIVSVGPYYGERFRRIKEDKEVTYLITSGNLLDVGTARSVGGFNDELFIDCVDIDFSFGLLVNRYRMIKVGDTFMQHKIGELYRSKFWGIRYLAHSPNRYYYNFRNNVYVYRKYWNKLPGACFKLSLSLCMLVIKILLIEDQKKEKLVCAGKGILEGCKMPLKKGV